MQSLVRCRSCSPSHRVCTGELPSRNSQIQGQIDTQILVNLTRKLNCLNLKRFCDFGVNSISNYHIKDQKTEFIVEARITPTVNLGQPNVTLPEL